MSMKLKISVGVFTYNQQDTIGQTLDSILMQKGDFDLELVIGEDCSPDNTYAICQEYAEHYPDIIKLLPNTHNLGILGNFARVIQSCTGELISYIAGDDFYCDDHALTKQIHYLQQHPEVGVMAANGYSYIVLRNEKIPGLNPPMESGEDRAKQYYFSPSYRAGVYIAPPGIMIRGELIRKYINFPEMERRKLPVEDVPLQAILSQYTRFACLPDLLVIYRVYKESATFISYNHPRYLEYNRGLMNTIKYLNELFPQDACITDQMLEEQMFYKEFLYHVYHGNYRKTRQLLSNVSTEIAHSEKVHLAKRLSRNWLSFMAYHFYKKIATNKAIEHQI